MPLGFFRQVYMNDARAMFIFATLILLIALVQKAKPTLSVTFYLHNDPLYLKAKFLSKLITSAILYVFGFYFYYFVDLTKPTMDTAYALGISILLYHGLKWAFAKLFGHANMDIGE
ncbi:hypothetical protein CEB3_c27160 [Peptococcaceae bacterium CEB3]|nr:hypothetical protein CEB3_c27160 [Peptococcaceae bacterium CEB3]